MKTETSGSWNKSTIDNNATWGQIRYLARIYNATGTEIYKTSCLKGIDLLINGQYDNGGWPQVFNDEGTYHAHITFNDTAMVSVLRIMQEIANCSGDFAFIDSTRKQKAQNSVDKGIECILNCQITVNGTLTAWCQQHDEKTLAPTSARAYELPSICTSESVGIVDFLRTIPNPNARIINSINSAVRWFDSVKIEGIRFDWVGDDKQVIQDSSAPPLWARFYDLEKSEPLFSDRDGKAYSDVSEISKERRTGYAWYGNWPANNVTLGTLPEPPESEIVIPDPDVTGNHLYVGYSSQVSNYSTIQSAVDAAANLNPKSEDERVYIHIAPGVYREQVIVNTPYISFVNDTPFKEVKITWYYAENAKSKSAKGEANRWGSAVGLKGNADYFRAEYITFENSFNRYVTDEEIADGVEPSGSQSITFQREKGVDVTSKTATERAAAIAIEGDYSEFYQCTFLGSQDTLFTKCEHGYFRECHIEGNTDYIFGQGDVIFQNCELEFVGYSDKAVGGYITAKTNTGKYLFYDCNVTATNGMKVGSGYFGRPWSSDADVAFVNTNLQYEDIITSEGWAKMSNNEPVNANFKEYNTTANGKAVDTSDLIDMVLLKKYLLAIPNVELSNWEVADICKDGVLNVLDLCMIKHELINKETNVDIPEEPIVTNSFESADFKFSGNVYIVGDSTVCNYDETVQENQNRCGWGMKIAEQYNDVTVTNLARAGRSSRSFQNDNEYEIMCNSIGKGDYLFVQFGHNDEKTDDADRGTYPELDFSTLDTEGKNINGQYSYEWIILNKYVKIAQEKGATVILVTPVTRRSSNGTANYDSHIAYAEGLVALGKEYNIPVIDMTTKTAELYTQLYNNGGADATAELHCYTDDTRTEIDNTHLSIKGCTLIADMIAEETANLKLKISEKLK